MLVHSIQTSMAAFSIYATAASSWEIKRVKRCEMPELAERIRSWAPASSARLARVHVDGDDETSLVILLASARPCDTPVAICEVALLPCPFSTPKGKEAAYIGNLYVTPQHRRRGIARALVDECERLSREADLSDLFLTVESHNWQAMQFWRHAGFKLRYREPLRWHHFLMQRPRRYLYHRVLPKV